eukprot:CAMPEP_0184501394 /NCGR_PEP_ID=MMETSP0113_2-20130426/47527_1 /TAXON_ID=91329 /ORGANISM="Norrisiella sphaerica, Strain BC52" /LENGTH=413 /DNA_ID=CAMNT_0026890145 /DNA_START=28 /DNA_END=1269 /DNA_ORIENTATION=-
MTFSPNLRTLPGALRFPMRLHAESESASTAPVKPEDGDEKSEDKPRGERVEEANEESKPKRLSRLRSMFSRGEIKEKMSRTKDSLSKRIEDGKKELTPKFSRIREFASEVLEAPWATPFGVTAAMATLAIWGASGGDIYGERAGGGGGNIDDKGSSASGQDAGGGGGDSALLPSQGSNEDEEEDGAFSDTEEGNWDENDYAGALAQSEMEDKADDRPLGAGDPVFATTEESQGPTGTETPALQPQKPSSVPSLGLENAHVLAGMIMDTEGLVLGQMMLSDELAETLKSAGSQSAALAAEQLGRFETVLQQLTNEITSLREITESLSSSLGEAQKANSGRMTAIERALNTKPEISEPGPFRWQTITDATKRLGDKAVSIAHSARQQAENFVSRNTNRHEDFDDEDSYERAINVY